ncbi:MAG TPA: PAS domain S-box protein [Candidatus Limnocylindria bacterium]|nr:PAS domain S-box protein [Candidatus Limnocylindria bacterium]
MNSTSLNPTFPNDLPVAAAVNGSHAASNGHSRVSGHTVLISRPALPRAATPEADHSFDDLLALAAHVCGAPLVIMTVGQDTHCWLAGEDGADPAELWRETRFCLEAVAASDGLAVVGDTTANKYWREHAFVRREPRIRFFASAPLITDDGRALGHLCVVGYQPHILGSEERAAFARLARQAVTQLELSRLATPSAEIVRSERRLKTLVDNAPAGFVLVDLFGIASFVSPAMTHLMGYEMSELIGLDMFSLIHPDDVKAPLESFAEIICTPRAKCSSEFRCRHKDGSWKWMEAVAQNFIDDLAIQAVACNLWDISSRKEAEAALRESESRFRRIMDSNMVGIYFWHTDGRVTDANERFLEMIGYTREDMLEGRVNSGALTPPEFAEMDRRALNQIATMGVCTPFEKEYLRKDGSRLPILLGAATLEDQPDRGVCFIIDVMDRKRMEQDLIRERNLLRTMIDHIPDYIYVKDTESRYLVNNKANVTLMGMKSAEETAGKTAFDFFPPDVAIRYHQDDQALLRSGKPIIDQEEPIIGIDGVKRVLHTTKVPLHDPNGKISGLVGISRDITDKLALEAQLLQSQKMECVGQLAGGVAHDFNNILTVVQGHAANLVAKTLTPDLHHAAQEIARASERAASLTRQLLAFSRRNVIQPKNIDLNETVGQMAKMLQRVLGEDIALDVRYASNLPAVFADPGMLEQVLMNLAVNSRDAMRKGGRLDLSLKTATFGSVTASHHVEARPGDFVALVVTDSGCGIPKENLAHIFEPFFTTKDVGSGTGLGLATVYGIVKQHNGWISVQSEVGRGTTFEIFLPVSNKPLTAAPAPAKVVRGGKECILLVEDEEPLRELVRCVLEDYGYTVIDAASGRSAFDVWNQRAHEFDLLLTDIVMPDGITGRDLAEALKQEKPNLRVLFSSGYSSDIMGKDFVLSDGINFLQKPYNPQTLAQTVRDCLDR